MSESRPRRWNDAAGTLSGFVKMAQSVARKGAPVLRIAYPIWLFSVILTPMPPLPVAPYERTSLDQPGWSRSCQLLPFQTCIPARLQPPRRTPSPAPQELDRYRLLIL